MTLHGSISATDGSMPRARLARSGLQAPRILSGGPVDVELGFERRGHVDLGQHAEAFFSRARPEPRSQRRRWDIATVVSIAFMRAPCGVGEAEVGFDRAAGLGTNRRSDWLAVAEQGDGGDALDAVAAGDVRVGVDVDLDDLAGRGGRRRAPRAPGRSGGRGRTRRPRSRRRPAWSRGGPRSRSSGDRQRGQQQTWLSPSAG